jgi:two-component system response regulator QseB
VPYFNFNAEDPYSHACLARGRRRRLDPVSHTVERSGVPVNLSAHEFSVLEALLQRPGAVLSRSRLEDRLYGWDEQIGSNAIEVYIHGLRRKLGNDAIRTLRGVGYFVPKP